MNEYKQVYTFHLSIDFKFVFTNFLHGQQEAFKCIASVITEISCQAHQNHTLLNPIERILISNRLIC